jgi:hypothetical protein
MQNIDQKSVICKSCNMIHTLDAEGNCEFCRRPRRDMLAKRDQRQNESQMLLTVLLLVASCAITVTVFGWTVFLVASNILWLMSSGHWYRKWQSASLLATENEAAARIALKAAENLRDGEWAEVIEAK